MVEIIPLPSAETEWRPIVVRDRKRMESVINRLASAEPATNILLETTEAIASQPFAKILKSYDRVPIDSSIFAGDDDELLETAEEEEDVAPIGSGSVGEFGGSSLGGDDFFPVSSMMPEDAPAPPDVSEQSFLPPISH